MDQCKGFADWLECLQCPHICTKKCPIEGEDVMEEMEKKMRFPPFQESNGEGKYFGDRE